ncbi:MAG: hypothetical protein Q4D56_13610, partial [Bacteroides sp.]|nr:hypothetical protein [Bacteroides sp.]
MDTKVMPCLSAELTEDEERTLSLKLIYTVGDSVKENISKNGTLSSETNSAFNVLKLLYHLKSDNDAVDSESL